MHLCFNFHHLLLKCGLTFIRKKHFLLPYRPVLGLFVYNPNLESLRDACKPFSVCRSHSLIILDKGPLGFQYITRQEAAATLSRHAGTLRSSASSLSQKASRSLSLFPCVYQQETNPQKQGGSSYVNKLKFFTLQIKMHTLQILKGMHKLDESLQLLLGILQLTFFWNRYFKQNITNKEGTCYI